MIRLNLSTVALTMLAAAGCGADAGSDQTVTGTINRSSFPDAVTHARAVGTLATVEAPIASDGTFTLHLPEHDRYRIELVSATRQSDLVFPRGSSLVDTSFYVEAARDNLALGAIRYIGDVGNAAHEGEGSGSDTGSAGGEEGGGSGGDTGSGGGEEGSGSGGDTGSAGGEEGGGSGDTSSGGSEEGGGSTCGGDVEEASGQSETGDAAIPETNPPTAIGCDDNEGEEGGGNGAPGSGGSEEGGGSSGGSEGGGSEGGGSEGGGSEGGGGSGGSEGGGGSEGSGGGSEGG